jgi:hypothetical protein
MDRIIEIAKTYLGTPYKKLDCSHFVEAVIKKLGYDLKPNSANQARTLYKKGLAVKVDKSASLSSIIPKLKVGDILFWSSTSHPERWEGIHHVAIYAGDGKSFESSSSEGKVVCRKLWESAGWQIRFYADISTLINKEGEEDIMLQKDDTGEKVYLFQHECLKAGVNVLKPGEKWLDMKDKKTNNGCDGTFGDYMVSVTKQIQGKFGLPQTGKVDALTYGRLVSSIEFKDTTEYDKQIAALNAKIAAAKTALG